MHAAQIAGKNILDSVILLPLLSKVNRYLSASCTICRLIWHKINRKPCSYDVQWILLYANLSVMQVRASSVKDVDSHYVWELIHLKSQMQRRAEKLYHLSNR